MFIRCPSRWSILAALALTGGSLRAQETPGPPATPPPGKPKYAAVENELAMYSPFESPWAEIRVNHAFESHLFNLLRAETRVWTLQDQLAGQDNPAHETAEEISRILHAQVLSEAAEALPLLQKTPNKAFASLLVHQLEAYPYEWKEEGSEELLPGLHKMVDPPAGKPTPQEGGHRRRRRNNGGNSPTPTPAASAAPTNR